MQACAISIDELEAKTGIDFFCNLPDGIEAEVEASKNLNAWAW
jgi:endonuclease G